MSKPHTLLAPLAEDWEWQQHGRCRGTDPSVFFPPENERRPARARRLKRAKALCGSCPVIRTCREHALAVGEPYGVWGGMSERELAAALRLRVREPLAQLAG